MIKKRSILFLLSDFVSDTFEKPLKVASRKHDVVALHIHDKREEKLPNSGLIPLKDAESGQLLYVDTSNAKVRTFFANKQKQNTQKLKQFFPASGVDYINILTGEDYVKPLINFFKNRGGKRWKK